MRAENVYIFTLFVHNAFSCTQTMNLVKCLQLLKDLQWPQVELFYKHVYKVRRTFENWSTFAKVIIKHKGVYFFETVYNTKDLGWRK